MEVKEQREWKMPVIIFSALNLIGIMNLLGWYFQKEKLALFFEHAQFEAPKLTLFFMNNGYACNLSIIALCVFLTVREIKEHKAPSLGMSIGVFVVLLFWAVIFLTGLFAPFVAEIIRQSA